jgi:drug/metabolite transporter (DMT)-like permease
VALLAVIAVTVVWGVTFVHVKDAVAIYPLFAFLAVRYAIATGALALAGGTRVRTLGRSGWTAGAMVGALLGLGIALQTAGLERTTVSSTGFITGLYVVLTPLLGSRSSARPSRARSGSASPLRSPAWRRPSSPGSSATGSPATASAGSAGAAAR